MFTPTPATKRSVSVVRAFFRLSSGGQELELTKPVVVLGRDPSVDIVLNSPGVSRQHARVTLQGYQYFIEDLGSSNGTFLNGQPISGPTVLHPNDQIELGTSLMLVFG